MFSGTTIFFTITTVGFFGLLAYLFGKWLVSTDMKIVKRREAAVIISQKLREAGLVRLPDFFAKYSTGNYVEIWQWVEETATLFNEGSEAVLKEFAMVRERVLDAMLRTEEGRALLAAKLQDAATSVDPTITKAVAATALTAASFAVPAVAPITAPLAAATLAI